MTAPKVTVAVPSFNQGKYLDDALSSIFSQDMPVEVFVMDGGSSDNSLDIIEKWKARLAGWRSYPDAGQSSAINEGVAFGTAPYVCWLNSDDWLLPDGLKHLHAALENRPEAPAAYGRAWNVVEPTKQQYPVWVEAFDEKRLALRCIVSQPATLIRRSAWEAVSGVDTGLRMTMDYDLWWKLYRHGGPLLFVDKFVGVNREHSLTKTNRHRRLHYQEARAVVKKHYGRIPLKWWLAEPYAVWYKALKQK